VPCPSGGVKASPCKSAFHADLCDKQKGMENRMRLAPFMALAPFSLGIYSQAVEMDFRLEILDLTFG